MSQCRPKEDHMLGPWPSGETKYLCHRSLNKPSNSSRITSAPALGPLIGGAISHSLGWRWIFWFLSIVSGACLTAMMLLLPETARGVVGNGSLRPPPYSRLIGLPDSTLKTSTSSSESTPMKRKRSFPNPLKSLTLLLSKDNVAVAFAGAFLYTTFCCISASLGTLFVNIYQLHELQAGLIYLPFGIGCSLAAITSGKLIDRDYRITAKLHGLSIDRARGDDLRNFPVEMARLRSVFVPLVVSVVSVIGFGWAVEKEAVRSHFPKSLWDDCWWSCEAFSCTSSHPIYLRSCHTDLLQCKWYNIVNLGRPR